MFSYIFPFRTMIYFYFFTRVLRTFDGTIIFQDSDSKDEVLKISDKNVTIRQEIKPSTYNIKIGEETIIENQPLELGGVYAIIISENTVKIEREGQYVSEKMHL